MYTCRVIKGESTMKKDGTKLCKYCKSEIPADAKVCPNCRKKQGMKIWQIILIVIVVIGIIGAMAGGGNEQPTSKDSGSQKESSTAKKKTEKKEEKTEFSQSETVSFKDVDFTVTNVKKTAGNELDTAKEGHEYVIVTIKIENKSDKKISYNPFDWKMENSNGQEVDGAFTITDNDTALNSGDLNAGGMVEGSLAFEQPQGDTGLKLNYYYNALLDENASFKIKID